MSLATERGRVAHLLRRATFGATTDAIDAAARDGLEATLTRLLNPESQDDDVDARVPRSSFDFTRQPEAVRYWLLRMLTTRRQFQEKMTLFWHGLLTSGLSKAGKAGGEVMTAQIDTYRDMALGNFRDLVLASAKTPAMILWLDNNQNRKGKPNENYARELMELFTLGIGNYSETDIREAARAFTGWFQRDGAFYFVANQHDSGAKTVLGYTGEWNGDDIINIVTRQPACSRFIARKLWSFFAYADPEDDVIEAIAGAFRDAGGDIRQTMSALFTHPAFYSERAYHALVKSPVEFALGFLRGLGATTDAAQFAAALSLMGQVPLNPPNVAGWPGGGYWVSTSALIARYNFVNGVLRTNPDQPTFVDVAGLLRARGLTDKDAILTFFIDLMVDNDLSDAKRAALADYLVARDDGKPGGFTLDDRTITNKVRGLIYLLATTPEYQMS